MGLLSHFSQVLIVEHFSALFLYGGINCLKPCCAKPHPRIELCAALARRSAVLNIKHRWRSPAQQFEFETEALIKRPAFANTMRAGGLAIRIPRKEPELNLIGVQARRHGLGTLIRRLGPGPRSSPGMISAAIRCRSRWRWSPG
jgi:hypothetical protein